MRCEADHLDSPPADTVVLAITMSRLTTERLQIRNFQMLSPRLAGPSPENMSCSRLLDCTHFDRETAVGVPTGISAYYRAIKCARCIPRSGETSYLTINA